MNSFPETANLIEYVVAPIRKNLGRKLETFWYYDIGSEDELETDSNGVDIIAHQLELKFEDTDPFFISWAKIDKWRQYSLCISVNSFCSNQDRFTKQGERWTAVVGSRLKGFEVYGYRKVETSSTNLETGKTTEETYHYEPHLLILHFNNNRLLGVANFYSEVDFMPKSSLGDDVWIILNRDRVYTYVEKMSLEALASEELPTTSASRSAG